MRTRAYRRHKQASKLLRRIKKWAKWQSMTPEEFRLSVMNGNKNWIRTTGRPCSCYTCSYESYKRLPKSQLKRIIDEQLQNSALVN